jgi:HEAT repeat protein/TolA-binding protein
MRHTLTMILAAAVPMLAVAQVPQPPQPASPPQRAEPAQRPQKPAPAQRPQRDWDFDFNFDKFRFDDMRLLAEDAARLAGESMRINQDEIRRSVEEARMAVKDMALLDMDRIKVDVEHAKFEALEAMKHVGPIDVQVPRIHVEPFVKVEPFGFSVGARDKFSEAKPKRAWASEDPADSLYRLARETLIRGEYRRAAQMFNDIVKRFPRSEYVVSCTYWEAFARYRSGSTDDLRQALRILDEGRTSLASLRTNQDAQVDVNALRARVQSALAARGDEDAARALRREANEQSSCDPEEMAVKAEALSALGQMDAASALPVVKKVLARRDECTKELRRRALYVVGRQAGPESAAIILDVAKNDTDANIRSEAMRWLPRVGGDNAIPQLEEMLRTSTDESAQRSIISALNSMDSERARRAVRAIIERSDASERVRYEAIGNFLREREGRQPSAEEQSYIRGLYTKLEAPRLREAVLHSLGRVETAENQQFLMGIVRNQGETPSLRATALERLGRMESVSVNDIAKLYDIADTRSLREQVLRGLSQRKEDVAVDKMIEIARKDTDPQIRRSAINMLARSSNKRAQDFIKEIFDR